MNQPVEPWAQTLASLCSKFGILLCIAFVLPVAIIDGKTGFLFELFKAPMLGIKLIPILILGTGITAIIIARSSVQTSLRGWIAAGLGFGPILLMAIYMQDMTSGNQQLQLALAGGGASWRIMFSFMGLAVLATGLLVRGNYPQAILGRAVATSGAIAILLVLLVPTNGQIPLIGVFKLLGNAPGMFKLIAIWTLIPFVLAGLSLLLVWLPASASGGTTTVAWLAILFYPTSILFVMLLGIIDGGGDAAMLFRIPMLWYHVPVTLTAWFALGAYGAATVAGKQLEHA